MVSKNQQKQIQQLKHKKHRLQQGLFVVEGLKGVQEFYETGWKVHALFTTRDDCPFPATQITNAQMERITHFTNPSPALGVFVLPTLPSWDTQQAALILDGISDPGNLGTLIRLADWFGYSSLICSPTTVDCFNPKVVQASMGSLARVQCHYTALDAYLKAHRLPVYGAVLGGKSLYAEPLKQPCSFIFGSESHGIDPSLSRLITEEITIPAAATSGAESLNVAVAAAVVLAEAQRQWIGTIQT